MRAEFAMIGMVDRDQRVDAGGFGGHKLLQLQLAAIGRQHPHIVALQADRRLMQIDQFDAGHRAEDILRRVDHAVNPGMAVQGQPASAPAGAAAAAAYRDAGAGTA